MKEQQPSSNVNKSTVSSKKTQAAEQKEPSVLTDPNSIYRKKYNRSLDFFLWVIDNERPPYRFKLHIQALKANEASYSTIKRSIEFLVPVSQSRCEPIIDVKYFSQKKQFKAFVEIEDPEVAKEFFSQAYRARTLSIMDANFNATFSRELRSYLVKTEEQFI